ncbi:Gfo/Idh/MocA family oxidoreductase [bacterium]|nr:Gfo/Idh/MocA family oxidoreductase [bacterium]
MKRLIIVGAGSRGMGVYADYAARHPQQFAVVGVAEPRLYYRQETARRHGLGSDRCWEDWRPLLSQPPLAEAVVVATQDKDHVEPALALLEHGYDVLLEKPMATTLDECRQLQQASRRHERLLVVAHVLRYTPYFRQLKSLVEQRLLGQLATVRHFEPVLYWHQAHSFVRGNWRNSRQSAPMILAKSCHDLDMICHLVGEDPVAVASFGSLSHFRAAHRPAQATDRCLDCPLADQGCAYSAKRFYMGFQQKGQLGWPLDVLTADTSAEGVTKALREGPYGRCVYACDNDVVDHQVVALEFASGVSATFTMTAFAADRWRETELLGSKGQLLGDGQRLRFRSFESDEEQMWDFSHVPTHGHGGGDDGLMDFFHGCLENRQEALARPLAEEAFRGHALCFAAEQARLQRRVIEMSL